MTVIVAAKTENDGVVMAADRLVTNSWQKQYNATPKLWTNNGTWAVGGAGDFRAVQVIKHHVTWPKYRPDEEPDPEAFMVKTAIPAIRSGVQGHGVLKEESGIQSVDAQLIAATGDHIFEIMGNGTVLADVSGCAAIGSGYAEAIGRLGTDGPWTEADVIDAVRRAIRTAVGCDGPISVVNTKTLTIRTVNSDD